MTTITFFRERDSDMLLGYEAVGHAGYAASGKDIVCAEVSALTQAILNGLRNILCVPTIFEIDPRKAQISARLMPEATREQVQSAQVLLRTLLEALQAIQGDFPRNVRIVFKDVSSSGNGGKKPCLS